MKIGELFAARQRAEIELAAALKAVGAPVIDPGTFRVYRSADGRTVEVEQGVGPDTPVPVPVPGPTPTPAPPSPSPTPG